MTEKLIRKGFSMKYKNIEYLKYDKKRKTEIKIRLIKIRILNIQMHYIYRKQLKALKKLILIINKCLYEDYKKYKNKDDIMKELDCIQRVRETFEDIDKDILQKEENRLNEYLKNNFLE